MKRHGIILFLLLAFSTPAVAQDLAGFWSCAGSGPGVIEGKRVDMKVSSRMEFSPNGSYSERGRMASGGQDITASGNGRWFQNGNVVSTTINNINIEKLIVNGEEVPALAANLLALGLFPADGETTTYVVEKAGWFSSDITLSNPELPTLTCSKS